MVCTDSLICDSVAIDMDAVASVKGRVAVKATGDDLVTRIELCRKVSDGNSIRSKEGDTFKDTSSWSELL